MLPPLVVKEEDRMIDWKMIVAGIFLTAWMVGFIVYILVRRKHD